MKVVYNACYGGFSISEKAVKRMAELGHSWAKQALETPEHHSYGSPGNKCFFDGSGSTFKRHDPLLVQVVEEIGDEASGHCAELRIANLSGSLYRIDEYDGLESVEEPESVDWIDARD